MVTNQGSLLLNALLTASLLFADVAGASCNKSLQPLLDLSRVVVEFKVKVMGIIAVSGQFHNVQGRLIESGPDGSVLDITVCINSVDTQNASRDRLLRSAAFFDVERFPTITFTKVSLVDDAGGARYLSGDLTLHGVSQAVAFQVVEPDKQNRDGAGTSMAYTASATIKRTEFGLDAFGMLVSDDVEITVRVNDRLADLQKHVFRALSGHGQISSLQY